MKKDILANTKCAPVAEGAMTVLDRLQGRPPAVQVLAATVVFKAIVERYGVRPSDAFEIAGNMVESAQGVTPEFRAVRAYMNGELQ